MNNRKRKTNIYLRIALGFLAVILLGSALLSLPFATTEPISYIDALFTSASCVCVTGLSVVETGIVFTFFGQAVMLLLIQIGGLGFMTVTALTLMIIGKRIGISERLALQESYNQSQMEGIVGLTRRAAGITFIAEGIGVLLMCVPMILRFGFWRGIWTAVFHSVSSFCNAGFDMLGTGDNIAVFGDDFIIMITTMLLIVCGGLGFLVVLDIKKCLFTKGKPALQTKVVLLVTGVLLLAGWALFAVFEWNNPGTIGDKPTLIKLLQSLFQSVTTRTAGFSVFPQENMQGASSILTMLLMFIGASPAGTGGGVKTTTFAVLAVLMVQIIRGKSQTVLFKRAVERNAVLRAIGITVLSVLTVLLCTFALSAIEGAAISGTRAAFESVSAFGTVGLSHALTPALSTASKIVIIMEMFAGRVGMLTVILALRSRFENNKGTITYPEGKIAIG